MGVLLVSLLGAAQTEAQNGLTSSGARAMGMGYASATLGDEWAMFNNIGGLARSSQSATMVAYHQRIGIEGMNHMVAAFVKPMFSGVAGISVAKFGDMLYSEQAVSLGYSHQVGNGSLGIKGGYLQYRAEGFDTKGVPTLDVGGIVSLTELITVGAYVVNVNQAQLSEFEDERIPSVMRLGLGFQLTPKFLAAIEAEKDIEYTPSARIGFEYQFLDAFHARTGFSTQPFNSFLGLGFITGHFSIDYAFAHSRLSGFVHQAAIIYFFSEVL